MSRTPSNLHLYAIKQRNKTLRWEYATNQCHCYESSINATLGNKDWLLIHYKCFLTSNHVEDDIIVYTTIYFQKSIHNHIKDLEVVV